MPSSTPWDDSCWKARSPSHIRTATGIGRHWVTQERVTLAGLAAWPTLGAECRSALAPAGVGVSVASCNECRVRGAAERGILECMSAAEKLLEQALALPGAERAKLIARLADSLVQSDAVAPVPHKRRFGSAKGRVQFAPDFDEPLADFAEYS